MQGDSADKSYSRGSPSELPADSESHTVAFLEGRDPIAVPGERRRWRDYIRIEGASEHNLKQVCVDFPLGVMTVVTGVSGSGKSTLVRDIFYRAMVREIYKEGDAPGSFRRISGDIKRVNDIVFVDQNPIGKSTRSNPATYLKAYDEIRASWPRNRRRDQLDLTPSSFSFNTEGGRCEAVPRARVCITIEMQFLADVTIECEECHGPTIQTRCVVGALQREKYQRYPRPNSRRGHRFLRGCQRPGGATYHRPSVAAAAGRTRIYQTRSIVLYPFWWREPARKVGILPRAGQFATGHIYIRRTNNGPASSRHRHTAQVFRQVDFARPHPCHCRA